MFRQVDRYISLSIAIHKFFMIIAADFWIEIVIVGGCWRVVGGCWRIHIFLIFLSLSDLWFSIGEQFLIYVNSWSWLDEKLCLLGFLLVCYNAWHVLESCLCRIERKPHFWCCNICHNIGKRLIWTYVIQNDQSWNGYKLL